MGGNGVGRTQTSNVSIPKNVSVYSNLDVSDLWPVVNISVFVFDHRGIVNFI